jgi:trimeric autotransporter adhesin
MLTQFFRPLALFLVATTIFAGCAHPHDTAQASALKPRKHRSIEAKKTGFQDAVLQEIAKTKDPKLGYVPYERLLVAKQAVDEMRANTTQQKGGGKNATAAAIANMTWQERGPNNVGGRVRAILVDKNDPTNKTVWAAGVGGGLWKTNDITHPTPDWRLVNDFFSNIAVTCIAQDPNTPNTMYFGTGEGWNNSDAIRGDGIWKTVDGGANWARLAVTTNGNFTRTSTIVVDGTGKVYAATQNAGLQRSTNGGANWTKVIGQGVSGGLNNVAADVEIAADGDVYVAFGRNYNTGGLYKSDAATHGATTGDVGKWRDISPVGAYQRVEIALAPSDATVIYALTQNAGGTAGNIFYGTAAAGDAAPVWANRGTPQMCDQGTTTEFTRGQAWYDLIAAVSPTDPNTLYIGGVDVHKTTDAGVTFNPVTVWSSYTNGISAGSPATATCGFSASPKIVMHADQHAITFVGGSANTILFGNDGGVYYGTDMSTTPNIISKRANLNITQYYSCAVHPDLDNHTFLAGAQDNGTQRFSQTGLGTGTSVSGGDGAFCHIDQDNPLIQISSYTNNNYDVTLNGWATKNSYKPSEPVIGGSFINPTDYDSANDLLYCGNGTITGSYRRMTTAGVFTTVNVTAFGTAEITHVMVSPNTPTTVYFGMNNGKIVKVENAHSVTGTVAGATMAPVSSNTVSCLAIETGNEAHQLGTFSNYGVVSVFETVTGTDAVPVWSPVEGNLPDMPIRWAMFAPNNNDHALLATELGVWTTDNLDGANTVWAPSSDVSLANTRVDMLQTRSSDNLIAAASHGRGLFTSCKYCPYNKLSYSTSFSTQKETDLTTGTTCQKYRDIRIPVSISKNPAANVVVTVTPTGTATTGSDFTLLTPTLTFTPNGTVQQDAVVRIFNDDEVENDETLILTIATGSGEIIETTIAVHTIALTSDDKIPTTYVNVPSIVGAGTLNSNNSTPFMGTFEDGRMQYIYTVAELNAAGLTAGNISALSINIIKNSAGSYQNFTIGMANTAQSNFGGFVGGLTTVYTANYTTTSGTNTFNFTTPFNWNGTSNIVVQFCYDNPNGTNAGSTDYVVASSIASKDLFARNNSTSGCSLALMFSNGVRANMTFIKKVPTPVQTALNPSTADEQYIGPNQTVHFYDNTTGNVMATIQNTSAHDFGCTKIEIDRAGTSAVAFWNNAAANKMASKTFKVTPTNNNAAAPYNATFYYTQAEINGWTSATGNTIADFKLIKVANHQFSEVTPTTTYSSSVSIGTTSNIFYKTTDYAFTAAFTGFSGFGGGKPGGPLPVSWLTFTGFYKNNAVELEWRTATELNNKGFEVERSADGAQFESIGFVNGNGTTNEAHTYTFEDAKPHQPLTYYRLRQIDFDGKTDYSQTIVLKNKTAQNGIVFYPNPAQNELNIQSDSPTTIKIIDAVGKLLQTIAVEIGTQTINISTLPAGVYYLHDARGNVKEFVKL